MFTPTRLSRLADGLMEACWLAALVVTPLFFNVYSSRIFEPDKASLLRSLALIMLAAGRARVEAEFTREGMVARVEEVYREVVAG
jgi:hypothetical protein